MATMNINQRLMSIYITATTRVEIVAAWLLTVSAHGDHLGHPLF